MTRSELRELAVHISFAQGVNRRPADALFETLFDPAYFESLGQEDELYAKYPKSDSERAYLTTLACGVSEHLAELDHYIEKYAKGWKVGRISRVTVAILRVAMYEVLYMPDVPGSVAINEAVEIAKNYEEAETIAFLNGILGSFIRGEVTAE